MSRVPSQTLCTNTSKMASQRTGTNTASTCTAETERGGHTFKISNYSQHCGHGAGVGICSATFRVGGHDWRIRYFPDGDGNDDGRGYVAAYLQLLSESAKVRLEYDFSLVNQDTGELSSIFPPSPTVLTAEGPSNWGTTTFMKKSELPELFLQDDCLVIECSVTVIKESRLSETAVTSYFGVQVPPSNLSGDLGKLFKDGDGVDITFKVKSEFFRAHKIVLVVRSPVFREQLYGTITDKRMETRTIEGMEPNVFRGLLHFIYTDSLPPMDDQDNREKEKIVKDLFAAADRYAMERMKLVCGRFLSKRFSVQKVTAIIALAHKHSCKELKDACLQFIHSSPKTKTNVLASKGFEELSAEVAVQIHKYAGMSLMCTNFLELYMFHQMF